MNHENLPIRELIDSAPDGFIVSDETGIVVFANRTAELQFGYERQELLGNPVSALIPERHHDAHHGHMTSYVADPRVRPMGLGLDLVGRRKDGSEFPVEISLSPLRTSGNTLFTAIVRDISEHKAMEERRRALELELETERERDRIAMDLHDGIMQDIYASSLALELTLGGGIEPREAADAIERVMDQLQAVVRDIRSYIFDLRPREFNGDLAEAISHLANEFQQNSQIATEVDLDVSNSPSLTTALTVYNIAHEALSNIQRHSGANLVSISLQVGDDSGRLVITDDGVGFDTASDTSQSHRGLRNMTVRARTIDADLELESSPGKGTTLSLRFPLNPPSRSG
ncbi:MAG TPA: PAS domain S-box protein [Dehalococcoidia bacterium]|nr:PAS domain S-box protein [Dehalococcoidia bacterium]